MQPRPAVIGTRLANWRVFSNTIMRPLCGEQGAACDRAWCRSPFAAQSLLAVPIAGTLESVPPATRNARVQFSLHEGMRGEDQIKGASGSRVIEIETFKLHVGQTKCLRLFLRSRDRGR